MDLKYSARKYMWVLVLSAVVIGFAFPEPGFMLEPYLGYLLMCLMFFGCLDVSIPQILNHMKDYRKKIAVLLVIHLSGPVLVLFLRPFLPAEIYLGLVLASVVSSGMSVVFLSQLYGGIPSRSLIITSVSNIFSPVTVPILVFLFAGTSVAVDYVSMGVTMLKLVVVPVVLVLLVQRTRFYQRLKDNGTYFSIGALFLIILGIIAPVRAAILADVSMSLVIGGLISLLVAVNFLLGYAVGSGRQEKITYAVSASYKNHTLSTVIALSLFGPTVALPSVMYSVINNLFLIPIQFVFEEKEERH